MALSDSSLGRSLTDVFAKTVKREPTRGYLEVDIGLLTPPSANPRTEFDQGALDELTESLKAHGLLQPIVVLRREVGYEILSGERRWRAAKQAGFTKVPVVVREEDNPQHIAELRLIENIQRQDLNPIELAEAYQNLLSEHGLTQEDLAGRVHKDRSSISNSLRLLTLPNRLRSLVAKGELSSGHAKALLGVTDPGWQQRLAEKAVAEKLSVRELERLARLPPPDQVAASAAAATPPHIRELEDNLKRLFGTRVRIKEQGGKGTMTLAFDSKDHFQRVVAIMDRFVKQAGANGQPSAKP